MDTIKSLMKERKTYDSLVESIKYLEKVQKEVEVFLSIIFQNKDKRFVKLSRYNINELFVSIVSFVNKNNDLFGNTNSLEINYFLNLLIYYIKNPNLWSLELFETNFKEKIKNLRAESKNEFLYFMWKKIFYKQINSEIKNIFDEKISELMDKVSKIEYKSDVLKWDIAQELVWKLWNDLKEEKIERYWDILNNIIETLLANLEKPIALTLYENNLIDDNESLYYFVTENKDFFMKDEELKRIYDFVVWLTENNYNTLCKDYLQNNRFYSFELLQYKNTFLKKVVEI